MSPEASHRALMERIAKLEAQQEAAAKNTEKLLRRTESLRWALLDLLQLVGILIRMQGQMNNLTALRDSAEEAERKAEDVTNRMQAQEWDGTGIYVGRRLDG